MDITNTLVPNSSQLNADDLQTGPVTVTITKVSAGSAEQPVDVHLSEFPGRAFRPSKSMRRVMVAAWGPETSAYTGRRMKLYRDPRIRFGKDEVGGIRISHMSHIDSTLKLALTVTRGKREAFTVEPLSNIAPVPDSSPTRQSLKDAGADFGNGVGDVASGAQLGKIGALMGKLGMNESASRLAYASDVIDRALSSANELTMHEASRVITYLEKDIADLEGKNQGEPNE